VSFSLLIILTATYASSNEAVSKEIYFYLSYTKSVHVSAHMRICDVRRTNEGANRPAEEIDAALSPAKRHATSLMHMTHVGREEEWTRKRERGAVKNKKKKVRSTFLRRRGSTRNVMPTLLYQRCNCHMLCVAILLTRAMSKRIGSGGISSMPESIRKLSPAFVGEEHWKTRHCEQIYHRGVFSRDSRPSENI